MLGRLRFGLVCMVGALSMVMISPGSAGAGPCRVPCTNPAVSYSLTVTRIYQQLSVHYEISGSVPGQVWHMVLTHNGEDITSWRQQDLPAGRNGSIWYDTGPILTTYGLHIFVMRATNQTTGAVDERTAVWG